MALPGGTAGEPIERLFVEIVALFDPFLEGLEEAMQAGVETAGKSADELGAIFIQKLVGAFRDEITPEVEQFFVEVAQRMQALDIGFEEAFREEFEAAAKEGEVLNMTMEEMLDILKQLETTLTDEVEIAWTDLIDKMEEAGIVMDEKFILSLRSQLEQLRLSSDSTDEFLGKVEELAAQLEELAKAAGASDAVWEEFQKDLEDSGIEIASRSLPALRQLVKHLVETSTSAEDLKRKLEELKKSLRDTNEETKKSSGLFGQINKAAGAWIRRIATLFIGIYAIRRAFAAFNRTIRESQELFLQTLDKAAPLNFVFREMQEQSRRAMLEIGAMTIPLKILGEAIKSAGLQLFAELLKIIIPFVIEVTRTFVMWATITQAVRNAIIQLAVSALGKVFLTVLEKVVELAITAVKAIKPLAELVGGPTEKAINQASEALDGFRAGIENANDSLKPLEDAQNAFNETMKEGAENLADLDQALENFKQLIGEIPGDLELILARIGEVILQIQEAFDKAILKAEQDYLKRLDDIALRITRRRADLERDLARDLEDIERDAAENRIKAILDFQLNELRIREDFNLKLWELENRFVLDLEDAVRERDARRVLMLQRRFNLEKSELESQRELRLKRLREDFELELIEIERQRQIRRQQRLLDFQTQLEDLRIMEERLRQDAKTAFERRQEDIATQFNERIRAIAEALANEFNLTAEQFAQLDQLYLSRYGPNGFYTRLILQWRNILNQQSGLAGNINVAGAPSGGSAFLTPGGRTPFPGTSRQRGGTLFATSPTNLTVGETPERVDITPLSRSTGQPRGGFGGGGGGGQGRVEIAVDLGEGLRGEIVDESLGEMTNVVIRLNEVQRKAAR